MHYFIGTQCCLQGAIFKCYPVTAEKIEVERKIIDEIGTSIEFWNDSPERTFEDVHELVTRLDI